MAKRHVLLVLLSLWCVTSLIACKPQARLGEGPPKIDERTPVLETFVPAALAERGSGIDLTQAIAGPPQPPAPPELPPPAVLEYGPSGDVSEYADLQVRFNRPMVPLGTKHEGTAEELGFTITPAIAGTAYWAEPTRLVFSPTEALPPAQQYEVRFAARLQAVDGPVLEAKAEWSFNTARPSVSMWPDDADRMSGGLDRYHWKARVLIGTYDPIPLAELKKWLTVTATDGQGVSKEVDVEVRQLPRRKIDEGYWYDDYGYDRTFEIEPTKTWPANHEILVQVGGRLTSKLGPLPMGVPQGISFHTAAGVEVTGIDCTQGKYDDGCELGPVRVSLSAPITRAQAKHVDIQPRPRGFDALAYDREYDDRGRALNSYWSVLVWGDFELGKRYEVSVDGRLQDIHGQPLAEGSAEDTINFVEPPPSLSLHQVSGTLVRSKPVEIGIESRHLERVNLRVALLDDQTYERWLFEGLSTTPWPSAGAQTKSDRITLTHDGAFAWSSLEVDLAKYTGGKSAAVLVEVEPAGLLPRAAGRKLPEHQRGLVQITDLGLTAVGSLPGGVVRVAKLGDDRPVAGAEIELIAGPGGQRKVLGKTDADGLLRLPSSTELGEQALLRARTQDDQVLVTIASLARTPAAEGKALKTGESVRAVLMSERPLYRPGEPVRAMGWAAIASPYQLSGLRSLPNDTKVKIELRDHRDELVAEQTVRAKRHGKFWATLDIPSSAALGDYRLEAKIFNSTSSANLQVKDFVAPEFEVTAEVARADLHHGESTQTSVNARYYFGGTVPITRMRQTVECTPSDFRPPGLDAQWLVGPRPHYRYGYRGYTPATLVTLPKSAEQGYVQLDLAPVAESSSEPAHCTQSVAVADATEREVGAETSVWMHPRFYLAASAPSRVEPGESARVQVQTLDYDGKGRGVDKLSVTLERRWSEPEYERGSKGEQRYIGWVDRSEKLPVCEVSTASSAGNAQCEFAKLKPGSYAIEVAAKEGDYQPKVSAWLWVPEPNRGWHSTTTPVDRFSVGVDQKNPRPGDKLHAVVRAPWMAGKGVVIVAKGGMQELRGFTLQQGQAELELEVDDAWIPGVQVWAAMIQPGDSHRHPSLVTASVQVILGNATRELKVGIEAPHEALTGSTIPIEVSARDHEGKPVRGHVSVWAVDEAVLALAPRTLPEFVAQFTVHFGAELAIAQGYSSLVFPFVSRNDPYAPLEFDPKWTKDPDEAIGYGYGAGFGTTGYGAGGGGRSSAGISLGGAAMPSTRSNFSSAPIFIADAELDAEGVAKVEGTLPDNLTTFRITAVVSAPLPGGNAAVEGRFGSSDARVRVTRPLVVRAALPRILRPGDTAEVGLLVDNLRGGAGEVSVNVTLHDAKGVLELQSPAQAKLRIDAGQQQRVPVRVRALAIGTPQFEVRASLKPDAGTEPIGDAVRLPLPIEPERTLTDRVAVYGSLGDESVALLPFQLPTEVDPGHGGLSVSIGSSMLGGVQDAVAYLVQYPYGCVEQTSSSLLPLIPLGSLAKDYPLGITDTNEYVRSGIERLRSMQLPSGGFAYWPGSLEANPYASAYATWVLGRAVWAGHDVPPTMLDSADAYLVTQVSEWQAQQAPAAERDIEIALMLSALSERGKAPADAITRLFERRTNLPVFSKSMLLLAMHATRSDDPRIPELLTELRGSVDEREAIARVEEQQRVWTWYWDSSVRSSALVLMAMLKADPQHPLVAKLARGLLDSRRGGRWSNTQENAYALVALADYAAVYEAEYPDFDGRVWVDRTAVATIHVEGRKLEFEEGFTPMPELLKAASNSNGQLLLERAGSGRMYYRVGLEWASTATDLPAKSEGIAITRTLRDVDGLIGETEVLAPGSLMALDVELDTRSELTHVAVEVPLPAGLEAIDLELGKGAAAMKIQGNRAWFVSHQELRRDRVVLFADHLQPGTHLTTVFVRATTPGEYVMPAASAEMMYYPEIYGRTTTRRISVN